MAVTSQPPESPNDSAVLSGRRFLLEILREQISAQDRQFDSLRTSGSILAAASGIVLTLTIASDVQWGHPLMAILLLSGGIAAAVSVTSAVSVAWPAALWRNPKPSELVNNYASRTRDELEEEMVLQWEASYTRSEPTITSLVRRVKVSGTFLGIAVLALLAVAVVKWSVQSLPSSGMRNSGVPISRDTRDALPRMPGDSTGQGRR